MLFSLMRCTQVNGGGIGDHNISTVFSLIIYCAITYYGNIKLISYEINVLSFPQLQICIIPCGGNVISSIY